MQTQNTPVHVKLWNREFWQLSIANLLLSMSVYMLLPVLPLYLLSFATPLDVAVCMGSYGLGLFLFGGFCSFLVQKYRRNNVCICSILGMMACFGLMYYFHDAFEGGLWMWCIMRLLLGGVFGLAQMILMSTLIIDTCESFQRTEANYASAWFGRFALSLGPVVSLVVNEFSGIKGVLLVSVVSCLLSILLIQFMKFPFKAPDDKIKVFTLDRFFLPQGIWLFVNLALATTAVGLLLTLRHEPMFYGMMMFGFFMALLAERFIFINADIKSEAVAGFLLIAASTFVLRSSQLVAVTYIAPSLVGLGIGITASRFQMFFIKLSRHCQRGTSQSTYILAWEFGLALGLFLGYSLFMSDVSGLLFAVLATIAAALFMYCLFTHSWYVKNKNR